MNPSEKDPKFGATSEDNEFDGVNKRIWQLINSSSSDQQPDQDEKKEDQPKKQNK